MHEISTPEGDRDEIIAGGRSIYLNRNASLIMGVQMKRLLVIMTLGRRLPHEDSNRRAVP